MRLAFVLAFAATIAPGCSSYRDDERLIAPDRDAQPEPSAAVYVAPAGRDFAEGTKEAPVATIARALVLSTERGGADVFVCAATYAQNIVVDRPVRIFGDRSCADWSPGGGHARFETLAGITARIDDARGVVLEDLAFSASADHTQPGSSAIAMFVTRASEVTMRRVELRAGPGSKGPDGAARTNHPGVPASGIACTCADGSTSNGGTGATGAALATSGSSSETPGTANAGESAANQCVEGRPGAHGAGGAASATTASPIVIGEAAIETTRGGDGTRGSTAQGGGGGGRDLATVGVGGNGGCGGCGGAGGRGGASGGSSIAVVVFASKVVIEDSTLSVSAGGRGGNGASGQAGQVGAVAGTAPSAGGCAGAGGGSGGGGSGGGGGAGGHSIAVVHAGVAPALTRTTLSISTPGDGGSGGIAGATLEDGNDGAPGRDGASGIAAEIFAQP